MLTERQEQILQSTIAEYINDAALVSSQLLEEKYDFGVSPATIRNELVFLSDKGYLLQPHTSAGRMPTDKGYRFFVDQFLSLEKGVVPWSLKETSLKDQGEQELLGMFRELAKELSLASSMFAAVSWRNVIWKEGWESLFLQPEFEEQQTLISFTRFVEDFEKNLEKFPSKETLYVSIGKENRFSKVKDFSIILNVCNVLDGEITFALLGPKRMAYDKNIQLVNSLTDLFHGERH